MLAINLMLLALSAANIGPKSCSAYIIEPGPLIQATKGEIWPLPLYQKSSDRFLVLDPGAFRINIVNHTCDILNEAIKRYKGLITNVFSFTQRNGIAAGVAGASDASADRLRGNLHFEGTLQTLDVNLKRPCEQMPHLAMDEAYSLAIQNVTAAELTTVSVWGALRALESFSQLLYHDAATQTLRLNITSILDVPRFSHRGLLLDTARHYIPLSIIRTLLDGMAYTKLNVFHWHIVDDQSFPYQSVRFPELSARGAYHPSAVYTPADVAAIVEYARLRGIRVLAELDTPGHTRSMGISHPELLTECEAPNAAGTLGPVDPTQEHVYAFMEELLAEVVRHFPDRFVHLGGDEVGFECWQSNANVTAFMRRMNFTQFEELQAYYMQRIFDIAAQLHNSPIVWEEVFTNWPTQGHRMPSDSVVHVWKAGIEHMQSALHNVTANNLTAIASSCWYLDHLDTTVRELYACDPHSFPGTAAAKRLVIGGEACMWGELASAQNVLQRVFPRACAVAEKLWSPLAGTTGPESFARAQRRLEEHTCRMNRRGLPAEPPNGPGYCY